MDMDRLAAFQACFTDWRLVKGRKVVQLVFEVPLEGADHAYQVLGGMPDPAQSVWCAVARLQQHITTGKAGDEEGTAANRDDTLEDRPAPDVVAPSTQPARATYKPLTLPQRVALQCQDELFQRFLIVEGKARDEADVIDAVRAYCGVRSRAFILPGTQAAEKWERLLSRYVAWQHDLPMECNR